LDSTPSSFTLQAGASRLIFELTTAALAAYHFAFNIPRNKILLARDWLTDRVTLLRRNDEEIFDFASWNAEALYFLDPDGNIVEFIARHDLSNDTAGDFSSDDLLEVSEVGLPVDDVLMLAADVEARLGISPYDGPVETFAALGDPRGLFIVSKIGRHWMPTSTPSAPAPIQVTIEGVARVDCELRGHPYRVHVRTPS
jgi:hypothetical protein